MKVLLAGATGYLGQYVARELKSRLIDTTLIGRNEKKLIALAGDEADFHVTELTDPASLENCCKGVDVVISTVGITQQKDGLTYQQVDYQANANLLKEAERSGVRKFLYVSAFKGEQLRKLKIFQAKEGFVDLLYASSIPEKVVFRPNGFFSDMEEFLKMASDGKVYLFGDGHLRLNPIHGADLAEFMVNTAIQDSAPQCIDIGGPEIFSHKKLAKLALSFSKAQKTKIVFIPDWVRRVTLAILTRLTPQTFHGPIEFFMTTMGEDFVSPTYGSHRLENHFKERSVALK